MSSRHHDNMRIQRLKRRKLKLKDAIHKLESELIPDLMHKMTQQSQAGRHGDTGDRPLTVGISSTALFDLSVSNEIYQQEGLEAYRRYQISKKTRPWNRATDFILSKSY